MPRKKNFPRRVSLKQKLGRQHREEIKRLRAKLREVLRDYHSLYPKRRRS
jgi:hypothetical protein